MHPVLCHQISRRLKRQKRTGHAVPQVHDRIDTATPEVPDGVYERRQVPVNVRGNGDAQYRL